MRHYNIQCIFYGHHWTIWNAIKKGISGLASTHKNKILQNIESGLSNITAHTSHITYQKCICNGYKLIKINIICPNIYKLAIQKVAISTAKISRPKYQTASKCWADSVIESRCSSVCLSVCDFSKQPLPEVVETSGRRTYS